jgi:hypothetical protein
MTGQRKKPSIKEENVRKLVEIHGARRVFLNLAEEILPPEQETPDPITYSPAETASHRIKVSEADLLRLRARYSGPVTLPSQETARRWLRCWREGFRQTRDFRE